MKSRARWRAAEQADEADEALGGTRLATNDRPGGGAASCPRGQNRRGHRFAAYPRCSVDLEVEGGRMDRRAWLVGVAVALFVLSDGRARGEEASASEVLELLKASGVEDAVRPMSAQIIESAQAAAERAARSASRPIDKEHLRRISVAFDPEKLLSIVGGVYVRHFTRQEVQDLLAFYRSPTGRRFVLSQAAITQEMQD